jgi:diketogulonate reductase-like aldo/keto reductase
VVAIAKRHGRTVPQIVFRFAQHCGMMALTGTTSAQHMRADLDVATFELSVDEVRQIERVAMQ